MAWYHKSKLKAQNQALFPDVNLKSPNKPLTSPTPILQLNNSKVHQLFYIFMYAICIVSSLEKVYALHHLLHHVSCSLHYLFIDT